MNPDAFNALALVVAVASMENTQLLDAGTP